MWALLVPAGVLHWLDFKSIAWAVAFVPLCVLIGSPIEAFFIGRRREKLHQQLEEQRYRWIKLGASNYSFDGYFLVIRQSVEDPEAGEKRERVWWAKLKEELMERVTRVTD
jgi:hypothetical protein